MTGGEAGLRGARVAAWLIAVGGGGVMAAFIAYGFLAGNGLTEVAELWAFPWFRVSIIDIYVGLALIAAWIWSRERWPQAILWTVLLLTLGNLASCAYLLRALLDRRRRLP